MSSKSLTTDSKTQESENSTIPEAHTTSNTQYGGGGAEAQEEKFDEKFIEQINLKINEGWTLPGLGKESTSEAIGNFLNIRLKNKETIQLISEFLRNITTKTPQEIQSCMGEMTKVCDDYFANEETKECAKNNTIKYYEHTYLEEALARAPRISRFACPIRAKRIEKMITRHRELCIEFLGIKLNENDKFFSELLMTIEIIEGKYG
jgi:hypothetical protein